MSKHTAGPWHVGSRIDSQATRICTIVGGDAIHGSDSAVKEWRSDANLIAAAPDLLEALESARDELVAMKSEIGFRGMTIDVIGACEAVIDRARGEA